MAHRKPIEVDSGFGFPAVYGAFAHFQKLDDNMDGNRLNIKRMHGEVWHTKKGLFPKVPTRCERTSLSFEGHEEHGC